MAQGAYVEKEPLVLALCILGDASGYFYSTARCRQQCLGRITVFAAGWLVLIAKPSGVVVLPSATGLAQDRLPDEGRDPDAYLQTE